MTLATTQKADLRDRTSRPDQTTMELIHVKVDRFCAVASDGSPVSLRGFGLIQVGRDNLSRKIASGWMENRSGTEICNRLRDVLVKCLENLAWKKTGAELTAHWAGIGQLLDLESHSMLSRLGMEFIGFLPGR